MNRPRFLTTIVLCVLAVGCVACAGGSIDREASTESAAPPSAPAARAPGGGGGGTKDPEPVAQMSLDTTQTAQPVERKIIRNGELDIESGDPLAAQRKLVSIAESNGGFVVTTESRQLDEKRVTVSATLRVPAEKFDAAIEAIRAAGDRVLREKVTGQDVTEEFVDAQARLRTKRAVEAQYLEIMKQAKTVPDVLAVQEKLGAIRAEIEQIEGRLRFLENQASLSTIKVAVTPPAPLVSSSGPGFFDDVRRALANTIDVFLGLITGLVWFLSYFIPFVILIGIPGYFVLRFLWRALMRSVRKPTPPA